MLILFFEKISYN